MLFDMNLKKSKPTKDNTVTVITPYYNSFATFRRTFQSVVNQSYQSFKWIIIDDGSSDTEYNKLISLTYNDERCLVLKNNRSKGPGGARNTGLLMSESRYVTFIDSDDTWDRDFLEYVYNVIIASSAPCVFTGYRRVTDQEVSGRFIPNTVVEYKDLFSGCDISCLSSIYDLSCCDKLPTFGEIPARNDLVFVINFLRYENWALALPVEKASYYIGNSKSVSFNKIRALKYQFIVSMSFGRNIFKSTLDVLRWALYGYLKYKN